jgi:multimeric flavodoxin WrbA
MSKILVISTSPRRGGNSDLLCDQVLKGAKDAGNDAVKLNTEGMNINGCLACDCCQNNGGKCVQKDDMISVINALQDADVVVFATPIYFYNMSAQLKTLIDRTYPIYRKVHFKKAALIVTAADARISTMDLAIDGFKAFVGCLDGVANAGVIIGNGVWKKGDVTGKECLKRAYNLGKSL